AWVWVFFGCIVATDAADIFVHDLFEPLKTMNRQNIARRDGSCDDFIASDLVVLYRLVYGLLEVFVLRLTDLRRLFAELIYVPDRCLAGDAAFREGSRRELVGAAADRVAGAEETFNGHHPVVSPLVFRGRVVLRAARPCA